MIYKLHAMWETFKYSVRNQKGQGMVEYGLIIVAVALVAIVGLKAVGSGLDTMFDDVATKLKGQ